MSNFDGKNNCKFLRKSKPCRSCKHIGVLYIGTDVKDGNPFSSDSNASLDHHYICPECEAEWIEAV